MAQTALYRKWRPQNFATIVGQKSIVTTLRNAVREQRISHAYIFSGPRGTGKTSTARILAKAVNCQQPSDGEPCNMCSTCKQITTGSELDVIEIDAASQTGVDNIRELTAQLHFAPVDVRKKVVIIDEVHMLSTSSFNALLKTLEEPPSHVLFILATTEMYKVPVTVISRCQRFEFKRITAAEQVEHLRYVCAQEQIEMNDDALHYLSRLSDGGMRDALSLLDQTTAYAGKTLTVQAFVEVTGGIPVDQYAYFFDALVNKNVARMLELVSDWAEMGKNAGQMLHNLIEFLRDMLVFKLIPGSNHTQLLFRDEEWQRKIAEFPLERLYHSLELLSEFILEIKYAANPQTLLELVLIKLCAGQVVSQPTSDGTVVPNEWQQKMYQFELQIQQLSKELQDSKKSIANIQSNSFSAIPPKAMASPTIKPIGQSRMAEFVGALDSQMTKEYTAKWSDYLNAVKKEDAFTYPWLKDASPISFVEDALLLVFQNDVPYHTVNQPERLTTLESALQEVYGRPMKMVAVLQNEWDKHLNKHVTQKRDSEVIAEPSPPKKPEWIQEAERLFGESFIHIKHDN